MKQIETLKIEYCGYSNPSNQDELDIEILGLEFAIKKIEARISFLKQSEKIAKTIAINKEDKCNGDNNELYSNKNRRTESNREKN